MLPLKALGKDTSLLFPSFGGLPTIPGVPWLADSSLRLSLHHHMAFSLLVSVSVSKFPSSYKDTSHWCPVTPVTGFPSSYKDTSSHWIRFTLIQYDLVLDDMCKDPISKEGHIHRCQGSGLQITRSLSDCAAVKHPTMWGRQFVDGD